jgi:hypothetical protein
MIGPIRLIGLIGHKKGGANLRRLSFHLSCHIIQTGLSDPLEAA